MAVFCFPFILFLNILIMPLIFGETIPTENSTRGNDSERNMMVRLVCTLRALSLEFRHISFTFDQSVNKENDIKNNSINMYEQFLLELRIASNNKVDAGRENSFFMRNYFSNPYKRKNMTGINIHVTVLYNPPMSMLKRVGERYILSGFIGDVWHDMQDILGFSYAVYTPSYENSSNPQADCCQPNEDKFVCGEGTCHTWSDLVGQIVRGDADVVAAPLTVTADRLEALHFSFPLLYTREKLFVRFIPQPPASTEFYLQPFSMNIWLLIALLFLVLFPMVHALLSWLSATFCIENELSNFQEGGVEFFAPGINSCTGIKESISHWLVESFGIFCQQGLQFVPQSSAIRLSLCITIFSSSVIYNVYSGSLASYLTVDRQIKPLFSSLEELLKTAAHSEFSVGVLENSSITTVLSNQKSGPYKEIWDVIKSSEHGVVATRFEGFQRACVEDFVFFTMEASYEGYRKSLQPCELHGIPESNLDSYVGISMSKSYEYADVLDDMILRMNEGGLLQRQHSRWWPPYHLKEFTSAAAQEDSIETGTSDPVMKISIQHISFAISLFTVGCILSLLILLCELISTCKT